MATTETSSLATTELATQQFAQNLFRELQQLAIQHEAGAMAGDVESVHDMRVGIRRLRVAMNNFAVCLRKKERKRWRARLEKLADALGGVRDLDVMIEALKRQAATRTTEDRVAIAAFVSRLRARRRRTMQSLKVYLGGEEYAEFKSGFSVEGAPSTSDSKEVRREQAA